MSEMLTYRLIVPKYCDTQEKKTCFLCLKILVCMYRLPEALNSCFRGRGGLRVRFLMYNDMLMLLICYTRHFFPRGYLCSL